MIEKEKYFCENCFENNEIKKLIRDNGNLVDTKFECKSCLFETYNEIDVEDCIQEYIDECLENTQNETPDEVYEENEEAYENKCMEECQKKYRTKCIDKLITKTFIIKKDILAKKLRETINKVYEHDDEHGFYGSASSNYWTEGVDCPCSIAGLLSTDDVCANIFDEDGEKVSELLDNYYHDFHECPWLCRCFDNNESNRFGKWSDFCESVKHKARYFDHKEFKVKEYLENFIPFFEIVKTINFKKDIFRARIVNDKKEQQDIKNNPQIELGKIPHDKLKYTKNNRFSPIGISYGYYSFNIQTILSEARVNTDDIVAIGEFRLNSNLNILDFTKENLSKYKNPFNNDFNIDVYCGEEFILEFIHDISKPINEKDTLLEYVPTQILAEYIWSIGCDGFIFDSSQNKDGKNLVLFGENPKYIDHKFIKVKEKNIEYVY